MPRHGSGQEGTARPRVSRGAAVLASLLLVFSVVPFVALSATGASAVGTSPGVSPNLLASGFPEWFEDAHGVRVAPCLDPLDTNCLAPLTGPGFDANQPVSFPGNFPDEFFYSAADSEPMPVADCVANPTGTVSVHLALEGAFANGAVAAGDQMVFGRIRFNSSTDSGLCGDAWYTFRTPYGPVTIQTNTDGTIRGRFAAATTTDIGCFPTPVVPCNFNDTLAAPVLGVGLLSQADGSQVPGYLGSGAFAPVTGGLGTNSFEVVKWPDNATPAAEGLGQDCNVAGCVSLATTPNFQVLAKLAGPLSASAQKVDFGGQDNGTTSGAKSVTVTNVGSGLLGKDASTISSVTVTGADAANFTVNGGTCTAAVLNRDATCGISVTFTPNDVRTFHATAEVAIAELARPLKIDLVGTGIVVGATADPVQDVQNLDFGRVRLTTVSDTKTLTITNNGTAPLLAEPIIDNAGLAAGFLKGLDTCTGGYVLVGDSCTVGFRYQPNDAGVLHSTVVAFNSNAAGLGVTLSGASWGGIAAVSDTINPVNTFPDWYQDERGVRVGQCDQPSNPLCIAAPLPDGGAPQSFPGNAPDEWFYYMVQSAPLDASDPKCDVEAGPLMIEIATEAAFLGPIVPNGGITFGRLRIVSRGGLCPNTDYKFTHPYGITIVSTDGAGDIKPAAGTTDVGCASAPCDYTQAISAVVFEGYMEQSNRPAGWLGDPVNPGTATGAPYEVNGQPFNNFTVERLDGEGGIIAETDQFAITGHLVGPIVSDPASYEFAPAEMGLVADITTKDFTFSNTGIAAVTLDATTPVTLDGDQASQFVIQAGSSCTPGAVIPPGGNCVVTVAFAPQTTGNMAATLTLHHSGKNSPTGVALTGLGLAPQGFAAISSSLNPVRFVDLKVGQHSQTVNLHIGNIGGSSPLVLQPLALANGTSFTIVNTNCVPGAFIQPGAGCDVGVRFTPTATGTLTDSITFVSNAVTGNLTVNLVGRGTNVLPSQSAGTTVAGFPNWFQDGNGVRLEQCLVNDGNCVLLGDSGFNPSLPVVFPTNYPIEAFYSIADSDILTFGPHQCTANGVVRAAGGTAQLRIATEATFATPTVTAGGQTFFNRIRITASGLCPSTAYTFVHPYGTRSLTTDGNGDIRPNAGTFDVPAVTNSAPEAPGVLRWDPNVAPAAPVGYIGHPGTLHTVVGSQNYDAAGEPINYFAVRSPLATVGTTDKFFLAGRLAGPVVASPTSANLGVREFGVNTATQAFTISNISDTSVTNFTTSLTGVNADQFEVTASTCGVATLGLDQTCTVTVTFKPTQASGAGAKTANLVVGHSGLRSPVTIPLNATSAAPQSPVLTVSTNSLAFGSVIVNTNSTPLNVTVRNAGTGALQLTNLGIAGLNPGDFSIIGCRDVNGFLITLAGNQNCIAAVTFRPTVKAARSATLTVAGTDVTAIPGHVQVPVNTQTVALAGTGVQGTISPSSTNISIGARAGSVQTFKLTLTNTGNANFSLQSTNTEAALLFEFVSTTTGLNSATVRAKFSAAPTGCANVAPGKNCQVTISFTPGNVAVNATYRVNLIINSNASNTRLSIPVTGTQTR